MHDDVVVRVDALERRASRLGQPSGAGDAAVSLTGMRQALASLEWNFARAVALEHEGVFPVVLHTLPESATVIAAQRAEHADIESMIAALAATLEESASPWRDERVRVATRDLVDLLRIHMRKEEAAIHRVLERVLTAVELALASRPLAHPSRGSGARSLSSRGTRRTPPARLS